MSEKQARANIGNQKISTCKNIIKNNKNNRRQKSSSDACRTNLGHFCNLTGANFTNVLKKQVIILLKHFICVLSIIFSFYKSLTKYLGHNLVKATSTGQICLFSLRNKTLHLNIFWFKKSPNRHLNL